MFGVKGDEGRTNPFLISRFDPVLETRNMSPFSLSESPRIRL